MRQLRSFFRVTLLGVAAYAASLALSTWVTHLNALHALQ